MPGALAGLPLWANVAVFLAASLVTFRIGAHLTNHARALADHTRAGHALVGALLLGGVASLPELVMSVSGAALGDAHLAITTLLGGVPVTLAMVALCDAAAGTHPVSSRVTGPASLLQGTLLIGVLTLLAVGIATGDRMLAGAGVWPLALLCCYVLAIVAMRRQQQEPPAWTPEQAPARTGAEPAPAGPDAEPLRTRVRHTVLAAIAIVAAGWVLAASSESIAEQSGLGSTIVGMVLGGIATSLPELSTIHAAVKLRQYELAFGDAFGSNLCSIGLIYFADLAYPGGPLLGETATPSMIATLLGILSTTIYLGGLIQRARFTVLRLGLDSVLALLAYAAGIALLYQYR